MGSRFFAALIMAMLLYACGVDDRQVHYSQGEEVQHGHPAQWVLAGHGQGALDDREFCLQCHVDLPEDMPSSLSCRQCHFIGAPDHDIESSCNACHGSTPQYPHTFGSHLTHTAAAGGYSYPCDLCHAVPSNAEILTHRDRRSEVMFSSSDWRTAGAAYTGTDTALDAYGSCLNTYCHSDGTAVYTRLIPENASRQWGRDLELDYGQKPPWMTEGEYYQSIKCTQCHGGYYEGSYLSSPLYDDGNPKLNSHMRHVYGGGIWCNECHKMTYPAGYPSFAVNPATHVNGEYDVHPDESLGISFAYVKDDLGRGKCLNVSCHCPNPNPYIPCEKTRLW